MSTNSRSSAIAWQNSAASDEAFAEARDPLPKMKSKASSAAEPGISVIIPVRNDPANLELCLQALDASRYPSYEVIVVDDASTDATAEVARRYDVQVIRQENRSGPATARNRGAQVAHHPYLFFVDADVCVQPWTLGQVAAKFLDAPSVDAFFGSYDSSPGAPNVLSQYRNLLHHYVHQAGKEDASSFWSGCGAIKKSVFLELGGFDTSYANASIEDIELGARLRRAGHQVALDKNLQVKHMKRWTFWQMIQCDIRNRGIPWTLLILRQGEIPNDLNLRHDQRLSAVLAIGLLATLAVGAWSYPGMLLIPLAILASLLLIDRWTTRRPLSKQARIMAGSTVGASAGAVLASNTIGHQLFQPWSLLALSFLLGIVLLNLPFYRFLFRAKHPLFVLLVMPLHVLYYLYSSLAFAAGLLMHLQRRQTDPS